MRTPAIIGLLCVGFGLGSYYVTGEAGLFMQAHLVVGTACWIAAALLAWRRGAHEHGGGWRGTLKKQGGAVVLSVLVAVACERAATYSGARWDFTSTRDFELAPATRELLNNLEHPVTATLYAERGDPRTHRARLLLQELARHGPVQSRLRYLENASEEAERFDLAFSNSIVLKTQGRHAIVERPTESDLLAGLHQLVTAPTGTLYVTRGAGESDFGSRNEGGFSGLAAALGNEGYVLRELVLAAATRIPEDARAVLMPAPRRELPEATYAALQTYLESGGRLVAWLELDAPAGFTALLSRWGFELPAATVVDPASSALAGGAPDTNPLISSYSEHTITRQLSSARMTLFQGARPTLPVRKPEANDQLDAIAFTSPRARLAHTGDTAPQSGATERTATSQPSRYPLVATGRYPRPTGEARIVLFGDSDLASNHLLRALYNADLVLNAVHWASERDSAIALRPKLLTPDQAPLTPGQALSMLYGIGLLLPELLLIAGALVWARRRSA